MCSNHLHLGCVEFETGTLHGEKKRSLNQRFRVSSARTSSLLASSRSVLSLVRVLIADGKSLREFDDMFNVWKQDIIHTHVSETTATAAARSWRAVVTSTAERERGVDTPNKLQYKAK